MKKKIKIFILLTNRLSVALTIICTLFGVVYEMIGKPDTDKFLIRLHIPLNFDWIITVGLISSIIMILSSILQKNFKL